MTNGSSNICAACQRTIDTSAKLCPFCGANPQTGERLDTQTLLQEIFRPREMTTSDTVIEYARQRQGVVIAVSVFVGFLIIAVVHQYVSNRNASVESDLPAVPLTEITDVTKKADDIAPQPLPELDFEYNGTPKRMRTYVAEQGAVTPPEVIAAQQAAAAAKAPTPAPAQTGTAAPQSQPVRVPQPVR